MARVVSSVPQILKVLAAEEKRLITQAGAEYTDTVKQLIRDAHPSGRKYRRGRRVHQASAPGEPFASDTGAHLRAVGFTVQEGATGYEAIAGSALKTSLGLEFGTRQMAARPTWRPALHIVGPRIEESFKKVAE
jgi:hypothetical protein